MQNDVSDTSLNQFACTPNNQLAAQPLHHHHPADDTKFIVFIEERMGGCFVDYGQISM